jgi:hypothetical protein
VHEAHGSPDIRAQKCIWSLGLAAEPKNAIVLVIILSITLALASKYKGLRPVTEGLVRT